MFFLNKKINSKTCGAHVNVDVNPPDEVNVYRLTKLNYAKLRLHSESSSALLVRQKRKDEKIEESQRM